MYAKRVFVILKGKNIMKRVDVPLQQMHDIVAS